MYGNAGDTLQKTAVTSVHYSSINISLKQERGWARVFKQQLTILCFNSVLFITSSNVMSSQQLTIWSSTNEHV